MTEHFLICKRVDECENGKLCTMLRHDVGENVKLLGCSYFEPKKPMTNEEYIRTCSTAELVHVIHLMTTSCYVCGSDGVDYRRCYFRKQCTGPKEIEEWLKEKHE